MAPRREIRPDVVVAQEALIRQLRADLVAERAVSLRLAGYVAEVLRADLPAWGPIPGWEAEDFAAYWDTRALRSLHADDLDRAGACEGAPIPVMPPAPDERGAHAA